MTLVALMLALLGAGSDDSECGRQGDRCKEGSNRARSGLAWFEFAPVSGAGMGAACACTTPTGAKGEALTFTRASNGTCTKTATGGLATTGIANGDLVVCSTNQPRVEYDSAGTLGLLVESARTNYALRSQELDNPTWVDSHNIGAATLNSANAAVAPDGTLTAEDYTFAATTGGQYQSRAQISACSTTACVFSIYVKGYTGYGGTLDLCIQSTSAPALVCSGCSYIDTEWRRCSVTTTPTSGNGYIYVGNMTNFNGLVARDQNRVYLWQGQVEQGATYATSPIPTTSAAATRQLDNGSLTVQAGVWASAGSAAMSWSPAATGSAAGILAFGSAGRILYGSGANILAFDGTNNPSTASGTTFGTAKRYWSSWSTAGGWVVRNATDANQATSAFTVGTWTTDTSLELNVAGIIPDGILSRICLDPDTTRCR